MVFAGLGVLEDVRAPSSTSSYAARYSPDAELSKSGNLSFVFEEDDQRRSAVAEGMVNIELMRGCGEDVSYAVCSPSFVKTSGCPIAHGIPKGSSRDACRTRKPIVDGLLPEIKTRGQGPLAAAAGPGIRINRRAMPKLRPVQMNVDCVVTDKHKSTCC